MSCYIYLHPILSNRCSNWEFQKKWMFSSQNLRNELPKLSPTKLDLHIRSLRLMYITSAQRRRIPPCAGSLAQKPSMVWTPRRPPRWLKPPTWTRQMARRPGQFRLTGTEMCRWMSFTVLKMGFNTSFFRFLKLHTCIYHTPFAIKVRIYRSPILNIFFSRGL